MLGHCADQPSKTFDHMQPQAFLCKRHLRDIGAEHITCVGVSVYMCVHNANMHTCARVCVCVCVWVGVWVCRHVGVDMCGCVGVCE